MPASLPPVRIEGRTERTERTEEVLLPERKAWDGQLPSDPCHSVLNFSYPIYRVRRYFKRNCSLTFSMCAVILVIACKCSRSRSTRLRPDAFHDNGQTPAPWRPPQAEPERLLHVRELWSTG